MKPAFRFLAPGRWDPFAGMRWRTKWIGDARGLIAHRATELHHWLAPELWRVELDDPVDTREVSLLAGRVRLVRPVDGWDGETCTSFVDWCVSRHPTMAGIPFTGWSAACTAGYVASQYAGADALERGADFDEAESRERSLQLEWVLEHVRLDDGEM